MSRRVSRASKPMLLNERYRELVADFKAVFVSCSRLLTDEAVQNVEHYLEVAELEMAYESFVLSVIEEKIPLSESARMDLLGLGLALGLDKEAVFRADFWQIAQNMFRA